MTALSIELRVPAAAPVGHSASGGAHGTAAACASACSAGTVIAGRYASRFHARNPGSSQAWFQPQNAPSTSAWWRASFARRSLAEIGQLLHFLDQKLVQFQQRMVERRAHGTDRRARIVHLTKEGRKLITRAYAQHAADMERLALASLTVTERATLIRLLKKIGYKAASYEESEEDAA